MTRKSKNKKCIFNFNNFSKTNILLFILIILVFVLIIFSAINITKSNADSDNVDSQNVGADLNLPLIDANFNYATDFKSYLDQFGLAESELINQIEITTENVESVKSSYDFIFNESLISTYGFKTTIIGNIIFEFKDYVMIYDPINENFNSIWLIQNISN